MMRTKTIFLIFLTCIFFSVSMGHGAPIVNNDESSKYLDYGKGHRFVLNVNELEPDSNYTVMIANNTIDAYNISFMSLTTNAEIHIDYTGIKRDIYNNSLTQLEVIFLEDSTVHFTYYINLKFDNTLASFISFILEILLFSFGLILSGLVVILIARKF